MHKEEKNNDRYEDYYVAIDFISNKNKKIPNYHKQFITECFKPTNKLLI